MAFNGKLLELKINGSWVEFPLKYVKAESYSVTPAQRMESSANRSASGVLKRVTCEHTASKIEFNTIPLTNSDVKDISTKLSSAYTDSLQRKLDIRYYDPSTDTYKTGTVYVPDVEFPILRIDRSNHIIHYNSIRYAFIEY